MAAHTLAALRWDDKSRLLCVAEPEVKEEQAGERSGSGAGRVQRWAKGRDKWRVTTR